MKIQRPLSFIPIILFCSAVLAVAGCVHKSMPVPENGANAHPGFQTPLQALASDEPVSAGSVSNQEAPDPAASEIAPQNQNDKNNSAVVKKDPVDDDQAMLDDALALTDSAQEYWEDNDMDEAIESLDQAYALILKVPNDPKLSQQKDDLRFMISKKIMELYASRQTTVKGSYNAIPMVINNHVAARDPVVSDPGTGFLS